MKIPAATIRLLLVLIVPALSATVEATNSGQPIRVEPQKTVTTIWRITNPHPVAMRYAAQIRLPERWKSLSGPAEFDVAADSSVLQLWCLYVPQATHSDTFQVRLLIRNASRPAKVDSGSVAVVVVPFKKLAVKPVEIPALVIAGDACALTYLVSNESNIGDTVRTGLRYDDESIPGLAGPSFWLNPGEQRTVNLRLPTNAHLTKAANQGPIFYVQLGDDAATRQSTRSFVQVIPRIAEEVDPYHRLPVGLTLTRVTQSGTSKKSGFQADLYAEGTLDEEQMQRFELRLKGPDIYDRSYFALHDEYYASYSSDRMAFNAGDRLYSLSRLTETYRYGRGFSGRYRYGRWQSSAYWMKTRWLILPEEQIAGQVEYALSARNSVGVNYLQKRAGSRNGDIFSVSGKLQPTQTMHINLEGALSPQAGRAQYACNVDLLGTMPAVQYFVSYIHAGPRFPGYFHDTQFINAGASIRTIGALRFNINLSRRNENILSDSTLFASPQTRENDFGMHYHWKNGSHIAVNWIDHNSQDRLPVSTFDYREQKMRVLLGQSISRFNYELALESGKTLNNMVNRMLPMERVTAFLTYNAGSRQSLRSFVSYSNDNRTTAQKQRQFTLGASARWQFSEKTFLSVEYQNKQDLEDYYRNRNMYQIDFSQTLLYSHQLSVRGRRTLSSFSLQDKTTAWMVDYRIPFNLPLTKIKNRAAVEGVVLETAGKQPVKDLVVQLNGLAMVTDRQGRFMFPALKPGQYYLTIECSKMGIHYVTDQKMPMELHLQDGDTYQLSIGVSHSAGFSGTLLLMPLHDAGGAAGSAAAEDRFIIGNGVLTEADSDTAKGLAYTAVELSKDDESLWRTTDSEGRFTFEDLRPGSWTCKIYQNNIPENYYLEKETFMVDLPAGSQKHIDIKVLPKKRKIRMLTKP